MRLSRLWVEVGWGAGLPCRRRVVARTECSLFTDVILSKGRMLLLFEERHKQIVPISAHSQSWISKDSPSWMRRVGFALFVCWGEIRSANFCPSLTCDNPSTWFLGQPSTVIRQNINPSLWHFQTVTAHQKHSSTTIT